MGRTQRRHLQHLHTMSARCLQQVQSIHRSAGVSYNITKRKRHNTVKVTEGTVESGRRVCYLRSGDVCQARAKLLPSYFLFLYLRRCTHTRQMAFACQIWLKETDALTGGCGGGGSSMADSGVQSHSSTTEDVNDNDTGQERSPRGCNKPLTA